MDNLQYIRDAIRTGGKRALVKVIRWQMNPATGAQDIPYEVTVNAAGALRELSKPVNKRSFSWSKIRPIGELYIGKVMQPIDQNSLSNPELLSKLKAELKAQILAEMEAEMKATATITEEEEKPKRKRKAVVEEVSDNDLDNPANFIHPDQDINDLPL
jgi:hypothetical protein